MTALLSMRAGGVVIGGAALAVLAFLVFGGGASEPQITALDCSSCDARHARLAQLRAADTEVTE
jgi:hypothetical protein